LLAAILTHANGYFSVSTIDSLISSPDKYSKQKAVSLILEGHDFDTSAVLDILIREERKEMANSPSTSPISIYTNAFCKLGQENKELIYERMVHAEPELSDRLAIVLGIIADERVHRRVREIYYKSANAYLREDAIQALTHYRDTLDVPVFIEALQDTFYVIVKRPPDDPSRWKKYYIRGIAAGALKHFGYEIENRDDNYRIIGREER
jgi:hypothetical protein